MSFARVTRAEGNQQHKTEALPPEQGSSRRLSLPEGYLAYHGIQRKAVIGGKDDPLEAEADAAAARVVAGGVSGPLSAAVAQPQASGAGAMDAALAEQAVAGGGGERLPAPTQAKMEAGFGRDLSHVRVKQDDAAAHSINARAFAQDSTLVFAQAHWNPGTAEGDHLIAHEVAHTLQQSAGGPVQAKLLQRDPGGGSASKKSSEIKAGDKHKEGDKVTPQPKIKGDIVGGGDLSASTVEAVNKAADQVPSQWRRFVAYDHVVKVGGSLAWRANNPGNLRDAPTKISRVKGASGKFAVFASMDEGRAAQKALYLGKYGEQTVKEAVNKLTPSFENNTERYLAQLKAHGVKLDGTVKSQIDPLMSAVKESEGVIAGIEVPRSP